MFKFILILALKDIILFMILMKNPKNFILIFIAKKYIWNIEIEKNI